ncbi:MULTISPECIES: polysaccharide biosynthesis tyrosine autokinase [unclassified Gemella]|uniref:polysaccharide biosynthesis tyrosine autokinase n=1 Tax=unclassified Gemella TaxID=2624949 RepID=UPI0010740AB8|nr:MULTISPECIES: polysaccharide biosynthesis tyrosine autokinase [unclassified Gemella]MBF0710759.1 polysaccharide biosynthesis tyrosine autokinase [Gemella sp. GL1.1]MBF0746672.1 polysaccharide biosynthesis tyrosine autokinase [Gemella sp. 19428wG2_WT2a]NYS28103.1 polysaccharide biosynthesis tyrosine autokinase [Gemella sp. GL1]TFU60022.1 polysaccharide biosynthesis tyrosine autokinase [Gemella sp. WT2a]
MKKIHINYNTNIIVKDLSEHYNALATNIQFLGKDIKTIAFSSVQPNEGKSTVTINLSKALSELGYKVLLIDADTRKSVLANRFRVEGGKIEGLTSYLSGNTEIENILYSTDIPNLTIIPAGKVPPSPLSLIQNPNFELMLNAFRKYYDYVIIDTPPIGAVIDAAIIAQKCDGSVLITESGAIKRKFVKKAIEQLESSGSRFLGSVLNKVDIESSHYGAYGAYGVYGKYGERVED